MTKTSKTPAVNKTSFPGNFPFFNCGFPQAGKKQADGYVLIECTAHSDNLRHVAKLNPATNELFDFMGTVPSEIAFTFAEESSTQPVIGTTSCHVADGWCYADSTRRWRLLFQADVGGPPTVVSEGTFAQNEPVNMLRCYGN